MGTLVRDGQSNVRRFFVRLNVYSDFQVPENMGKSTVQKWSENGSRPALQSPETSIYRQIVSPAGLKKGTQKRVQKRPQIDGQKYVQNRIRNDGHEIAF
jgi:hypothetical protein